jgi:hypothetical protein
MNTNTADRTFQDAFPGYLQTNNVITIQAEGVTFHVAYSDLREAWVIQTETVNSTWYGCQPTLAEAFARVAQML